MFGELSYKGILFDIGHADGIIPILPVPEKQVPTGLQAG